jgi:hypothetical protein
MEVANMKRRNLILIAAMVIIGLSIGTTAFTAYNHQGDIDSANFRTVYPDKVGTKLDSCTTCHRGSTKPQDPVTYGSCQWCHYVTNYGADLSEATLLKTLNSYGLAYKNNGRDGASLEEISSFDSDGDTYNNETEIIAGTYPGDKGDNPNNVPAPSIVLSLEELEQMAQHSQFLLMNASKSDDAYTEYSGVALESLIKALMLESANGITVYSPDGFATYHPFQPVSNPNSYHVFGTYPPGTFYYDQRADIAIYPPDPPNYPTGGWCDYSSPSAEGRENGSSIINPDNLKLMLAFERDGECLTPGILNSSNKLDGEGPFRVVPPQKKPGWPDQRSSSTNQSVSWYYDKTADHNAGFSSRTVTMIKVEPMPAGTTDINTMEAGWPYVDEKKIIIYGSINPYPVDNLNKSLDYLIYSINMLTPAAFRNKSYRKTLVNKIEALKKQVAAGAYSGALSKLREDILKKTDGYLSGDVDANDWISDIVVQRELVSQIQTIWILLVILGG